MLLDTNITIFLQDEHRDIWQRLLMTQERPAISLVTLVELEGGIAAMPIRAAQRREALSRLLPALSILPFDQEIVRTYGRIVAATGFSRPRVLDRLIAATALVHDLTLATCNGPDFRDIPGLKLEVWPRPSRQAPQ